MKNNTPSCIVYNPTTLWKYLCTTVLAIFSVLLPITGLYAQGSLLLTPRRVVFEGNKTSESINLANSGTDTAHYIISLVQFRMKEDGSFEEITQTEAGHYSAEPYLRYFPRTVTLAPNEGQVIRMQLNKLEQMEAGEYRSHLYVRAVPKPTSLGEEETRKSAAIGVKLVPIFGVSIPVIIRIGEPNATVSLSIIGLQRKAATEFPTFSLIINRSGNISVYGDILVTHIALNGKSTVVGNVKGLAVYTPNFTRHISVPLDKFTQVDNHSGKLVVQFITHVDDLDKIMAEAELALQ